MRMVPFELFDFLFFPRVLFFPLGLPVWSSPLRPLKIGDPFLLLLFIGLVYLVIS